MYTLLPEDVYKRQGIAEAPLERADEVIAEHKQKPKENSAQIVCRARESGDGRIYPAQNCRRQKPSDKREGQGADSIEGDAGVGDGLDPILPPLAQLGRDEDVYKRQAYGGVNSPYVWLKTPGGMDSWSFFDKLLKEANVAGTPGAGFGAAGEGYFRLTAFNTPENTERAIQRFASLNI